LSIDTIACVLGLERTAVDLVGEAPRAVALLKPPRLQILAAAKQPASATSIAATLGLTRQSVNYHVRQLARAGFLRRAGRQRRRGLVEQKFVVSARAVVLAPDLVAPFDADPQHAGDRFSAAYLLTLAVRMQREVGQAWRGAQAQGKRLPLLALDTEIAFDNPSERARFADALSAAIARVIAEHTLPATAEGGRPPRRRYRLALGCYPIPASHKDSSS
jgi:biotin operon repressor